MQKGHIRFGLNTHGTYFLAIFLLWAFFAQCVTGMITQSPTVDEEAHLMRGYLFAKTGEGFFKFGHPILADALSGLPVRAFLNLNTFPGDQAYADNAWGDFSEKFIWQPGYNIDLIFSSGDCRLSFWRCSWRR